MALYNKICHFQPILESTPDLIEETFVCADFTVCVYFPGSCQESKFGIECHD